MVSFVRVMSGYELVRVLHELRLPITRYYICNCVSTLHLRNSIFRYYATGWEPLGLFLGSGAHLFVFILIQSSGIPGSFSDT